LFKFKKTVYLIVALSGMVGCMNVLKAQDAEQIVRGRAASRWQALIEGRLETAYTYLTPEYRSLYDFKRYRRTVHGVGVWQKADVNKVTCAANKCLVNVELYVRIKVGRGFKPLASHGAIDETWVRDSGTGEWFYFSKP